MIRLRETAEVFDNIYDAREGVLRLAAKADAENKITATLLFDAKQHRFDKPLVFDAEESTELKNLQLSLVCENGGTVLTSNFPLDKDKIVWEETGCSYQFEADEEGKFPRFNDFYRADYSCKGETRMKLCTSQHFTHAFDFSAENGKDNADNLEGIYIPKEIADLLPDGNLSPMTFTIYVEWEFYTLHVLSVDRSRTKTDRQGNTHVLLKIEPDELYLYVTKMNQSLRPENRECFLSNHEVFLKEDEWCYNHISGLLRFRPKETKNVTFSVPKLSQLLVFNGMDGVTLKNLIFTGVTDQYLADHGYLSHQANVEKRGLKKIPEAAVFANNTRGLTVSGCEFRQLGVNGILMLGTSARVSICDNWFHDISMSAISIGDPVKACVEPQNASYGLRIDRNSFSYIAYEFPSAPAVDIFRVDGLSICHNTIEKTPYSAISVGWQWTKVPFALGEGVNIRDAEIAYNKITDFVQVLKDGGAIYVVGANCERSNSRRFNSMHDNFAKNDYIKDTVMGYYLDGASSNWEVYDNVISNTHRPFYAQHHPHIPEQNTWHNSVRDLYSTDEVLAGNHHPERDTLLGTVYTEPTLEKLFEVHPKAKQIFEASGREGCRTIT